MELESILEPTRAAIAMSEADLAVEEEAASAPGAALLADAEAAMLASDVAAIAAASSPLEGLEQEPVADALQVEADVKAMLQSLQETRREASQLRWEAPHPHEVTTGDLEERPAAKAEKAMPTDSLPAPLHIPATQITPEENR